MLPLAARGELAPGLRRAALVWCVARDDDPLAALDERQRSVLLASLLPAQAGQVRSLTALRAFALGLNAERSLVQGRIVRIGNAAQTLHPVAGQGLNLGLGDVQALAQVLAQRETWRSTGDLRLLRRYERQRKTALLPMGLTTDGLQRLFSLPQPPWQLLRNWGMLGFDRSGPLKEWMARQAMGTR